MRNPVREFRLQAVLAFSALALLLFSGCAHRSTEAVTGTPEPPEYIKVIGVGNPGAGTGASATGFSGQLSGPLRADASAALDPQIADPAQRSLMARAEARRKALRALGTAILARRDAQGATLGDALKQHPTDQSKLNALLEEKAQVAFTQEGQGVHAAASVESAQVNEALGLGGAKPPGAGPMPLDSSKEAAYNQAVEDAKQKLQQQLEAIKLADGRTVKQALEDSPDAAVDYKALLWVVQPDETQYNSDGSCQVTIIFDSHRVTELFKSVKSWWQFWK